MADLGPVSSDLTIGQWQFLDLLMSRGGANVIPDAPGVIRSRAQYEARELCAQHRLAIYVRGDGWSITDAGQVAWQAWPKDAAA